MNKKIYNIKEDLIGKNSFKDDIDFSDTIYDNIDYSAVSIKKAVVLCDSFDSDDENSSDIESYDSKYIERELNDCICNGKTLDKNDIIRDRFIDYNKECNISNYNLKRIQSILIDHIGPYISDVNNVSTGYFWFNTNNNSINIYDGKQFISIPAEKKSVVVIDPQNETYNKNSNWFNRNTNDKNEKRFAYKLNYVGRFDKKLNSINKPGFLWFNTLDNSVNIFDGHRFVFVPVKKNIIEEYRKCI